MSASPERLTDLIRHSWSRSTSSTPKEWDGESALTRGQCVPTSLVLQDYMGGDIERLVTTYNGQTESHYRLVGADDLTRSQYPAEQSLLPETPASKPDTQSMRDYLLSNSNTRRRYEMLASRVAHLMNLDPERAARTVYIDMDGVLYDFEGETVKRLLEHYPGITMPAATDFYITRRFPAGEIRSALYDLQATPGLFRDLPLIDGAQEAWQRIKNLGYYPVINTSPFLQNPTCVEDKRLAIARDFGDPAAAEMIVDKDKYRYHGIALIDDRPVVDGWDRATWQHIIYTQDYNRHISPAYRIENWRDHRLAALLAQCAERATRL